MPCLSMRTYLAAAALLTVAAADEEIGSPLRVAQCRARCIQRFSESKESRKQTSCLQGPDCYMCWENCQLLQSNFAVWGAICDEKGICFPGCKEACQFHSEAESQRVPVIQTRGEDVVESGGGVASWPRPREGGPFVFVVMRRSPGAPWRQITQTEEHSARVPDGGTLRVLAVSQRGLATIYSPASGLARARQVLASIGSPPGILPPLRPTNPPTKRINTEIQPSTPFSFTEEKEVGRRWELHEDSLIHQKVLVIAEISWERAVEGARSVYFVTWEVDGGGLKGNLFTDSTSVTLSLWPDTIYHIQVELVGDSGGSREKSEVLVVDTSRAVGVEMASEGPRRVPAPRGGPPPELALGLVAALALFALLLVLALAARRRRSPPPPLHKLVDPPNLTRMFPPMVSVVTESPSSPHRTPRTLHV